MSRAKTKKGVGDSSPRPVREEENTVDFEKQAKELRALIADRDNNIEEMRLAIDKLRDELRQTCEDIKSIRGDAALALSTVERLREEVKRGVISESAVLGLEEYRKARDAGRSRFILAKTCTHAALSANEGAEMRIVDYSQSLVEDLISSGRLKLKAAI